MSLLYLRSLCGKIQIPLAQLDTFRQRIFEIQLEKYFQTLHESGKRIRFRGRKNISASPKTLPNIILQISTFAGWSANNFSTWTPGGICLSNARHNIELYFVIGKYYHVNI